MFVRKVVTLTDSHSLATRTEADALLARIASPEASLRDDQWLAISSLVDDRKRMLVVQRTGWGKSAVYFIAAKLLRERGNGPSVIISPLLALMRNQVEAAARAGIRATTINSANITDWEAIHQQIAAGDVDVLLISPERLNNPDFRDNILENLSQSVGMVVVDEAHCISDWGHDFRPDYRRIKTLLNNLPASTPVLATTATANDRVAADIASQLGENTGIIRGGLERESLSLNVVRLPDPTQRPAWISQALSKISGTGIIYCLTVAAAEDLADALRSQGHNVYAYTGKTETGEREALENALINNEIKALVATSALGMGFDKPDLAFVFHLGAPSSPISYYQQVGRAGRGTDHAEVVLLPGPEDQRIWEYFASVSMPQEDTIHALINALGQEPLSTAKLEAHVDLSRSRIEQALKVLDVDGAVKRVRGGWIATGNPWTYDRERYAGVDAARKNEQASMLAYQSTDQCRMLFLRNLLNDPTASTESSCGRCDNCRGETLSQEVEASTAQSMAQELNKPGVPIPHRKMWPTGSVRRGKIKGNQVGKALGRLNDISRGPALIELLQANTYRPQAPWKSDPWLPHIINVLASWDWDTRPTSVAVLGSRHPDRHDMMAALGSAIAQIGRMEFAGVVSVHGEDVTAQNSVLRVNGLNSQFDTSSLELDSGATVLLLTDVVDTGWSATIAAADIAEAYEVEVLTLALASTN